MNTQDLIELARERAHHVRDGESFVIGVEWALKQIAASPAKAEPTIRTDPTQPWTVEHLKNYPKEAVRVLNERLKADERGSAEPMKRRPSWRALPPEEDGQPSYNAQGTTPARDGSEPGLREDIAPINEGARRRPAIVKGKRAEPQGLTDAEIWAIFSEGVNAPGGHPVYTMDFDLWFARAIESAVAARASAAKETK